MRIEVLLPDGKQDIVLSPGQAGRRLSEILRSHNLPLNTRCGERDMCAGCLIELVHGQLENVDDGSILIAGAEALKARGSGLDSDPVTPNNQDPTPSPEFRGCRYRPTGDSVTIRVPQRSRLAYAPEVLDSYRVNVPYARDPIMASGVGVAIDIGTTTVALQVLDLASGEIVGKASGFNKQMHFGDDVLTRINLCSTDPEMLGRMREAIVQDTILPLIREALESHPAPGTQCPIRCFTIAGNTTMLHLLAGEDPTPMGFAPFTPRFLEREPFEARLVGLEPDGAMIFLLPSIAAYIGADLTAGLFASGLLYDEGPSLLVDVGTNGEILLGHQGHISGCATAAGPAFEGCGLTCGIRAGEGAIAHVRIAGTPQSTEHGAPDPQDASNAPTPQRPNASSLIQWERIGPPGMKPTGICGSAYVDFLAEGRRSGLLTSTGRFRCDRGELESESPNSKLSKIPPKGNERSGSGQTPNSKLDLSDHFVDTPHGRAIRLAFGQGKRPILVSESDVAKLLQAKAAIAAGILTLLGKHSLHPRDVKTLYLAGGFGMHLNLANAIACGLLPGFAVDQIQLVGNTSLAGATLALLDRNTLGELAMARDGVEVVELNLDPGFEDTYLDQLSLP
ncbi:MAG: ASKHA domain-containing protein [Fimbriimonadales bacterium]